VQIPASKISKFVRNYKSTYKIPFSLLLRAVLGTLLALLLEIIVINHKLHTVHVHCTIVYTSTLMRHPIRKQEFKQIESLDEYFVKGYKLISTFFT
jgi:hypothetical protein